MRRASLLTVSAGWLVGLVLVVGCGGDAMAPQLALVPPPSFAFSDGAHSGGTPHFFFLPPIVSTLPPVTGSFDGTLAPSVQVCEWTGASCTTLVAEFTKTSGTGGQPIRVDPTQTRSYWVVWDTRQCVSGACVLDPAKAYRLRVLVGAAQLGFADVKVATTLAELKAIDRAQFAPLLRNAPFLIAFRIEQGAVTVLQPGGSAVVGSAGGLVASADGQVALAIPSGALPTATTISVNPATNYPAGSGSWSPVVDLGPTGTTFAAPVTLTLSYDPTKLPPGVPPSALSVYLSDGTGWDLVSGSIVNAVDNTVSVPISHFSAYTLTVTPTVVNGVPNPTTINVGQATTLTGYVFGYQVVPSTICYYTGFPRHRVCYTYSTSYSYPVPNQAVSWTALPTGTPVVSLASARTYTDQAGATTSPLVTGRASGAAQIVASLFVSGASFGSVVQSTPVTITVRACAPAPAGLVSWWPGEGVASDIIDGNNGMLQGGATFAAGKVGQAFLLNGIDGYVDAGNAPNLRVSSGDFTVEVWVRFDALSHPPGANSGAPQGDMSIVDKMSASGTNVDGWRLLKQQDNRFWFCLGGRFGNQCGSSAFTVFSSTVAQTGIWYHVAVVKSSSGFSIYVNGVQEDARSTLPNFLDTHTANLRIGSYALEGSHLNGEVDEVSIYNRALSGQEIQDIYAAGGAGKCPGSLAPGWTTKAPMPTALYGMGAATINGVLYVVGGVNDRNEVVGTVEAYDPATNTWSPRASLPTPRFNLGTTVINGVLYAVGGYTYGYPPRTTVEAYDPTSDTWTTKASMPTGRGLLGVAAINGILYAVGGDGGPRVTVEAYDPTSDTWTTKAPMPTGRVALGVTVINGILYAVGGGDVTELATVEAYDPTTDTWTSKASMPTKREGLGVTAINSILYAVGGDQNASGGTVLATVEAYDPSTDSWTTKASMPTARWGLGVAAINGVLYAIGGVNNGIRTEVEAYSP